MPKLVLIKTDVDMQIQFMNAFKMDMVDCDQPATLDTIQLWWTLIQEEANEVGKALDALATDYSLENLAEVGKELADLKVVTNGLAVALGLPLDDIYQIVHQSNMAKLGPNGELNRRPDGKILKPEGWKKPDILALLNQVIAAKNQRVS